MIAPFMSCSARLPVYTLMIATAFADHTVLGFISVGVLVILGMYLFGIGVALVVATILKRTILKSSAASFVMELPPYRLPIVSNVAHAITSSVGDFALGAGGVSSSCKHKPKRTG
jgi:ferrous iron transport protein B